MVTGLLPIGSVVLLKDSTKKAMIVGVCQRSASDPQKMFDYVGVVFPEGFMSGDKMLMFNNDQLQQVFALGYQDAEQMAFRVKAEQAWAKMLAQ